MRREYKELKKSYVEEMRISKENAMAWWAKLEDSLKGEASPYTIEDLWPMGPASHPWVIATLRKYYFLCDKLNKEILEKESDSGFAENKSEESNWGQDERKVDIGAPIDPKVFVYELISGEKTQDLYEFLQFLVFVPIGLINGEDV